MINLKKIVAVTLTAAMCMGLSVTAFAASDNGAGKDNNPTGRDDRGSAAASLNNWNPDSKYYVDQDPNNNGVTAANGSKVETTNGKGETNYDLTISKNGISASSRAYDSINTAEEVANIIKENGLKTNATSISPEAVVVVTGLSADMENILTFTLPAADFTTDPYDETRYHAGDEIWAMFETGEDTGVWEMRSGIIGADGKVDFEVDHKGAVILLKTLRNGKIAVVEKDDAGNELPPVIIDPDEPGNNVVTPPSGNQGTSNGAAAGAATTGTSPRTGEF